MKIKLLYPFVSLILVSACSTSTSPYAKAKKNIEAYIKPKLNDPSSYEFVSMDSLVPYTLADEKQYQAHMELIKEGYNPSGNESVDLRLKAVDIFFHHNPTATSMSKTKQDEVIDSITKQLALKYGEDTMKILAPIVATRAADSKIILEYNTHFSYRAKNKLGALGLETSDVKLDTTYNLTDFRTNRD